MNTSKESKLNRLVTSVASGTCNATAYFAEQGYSYRLLHNYEESGWLEFLERGAFIRKGDQVDWFGGLYAIQKQLKKKIHVGGKTALLLQGYGQSVPLGKEQVHLFGPSNETLPKWFTVHKWGADIHSHFSKLFNDVAEMGLTEKDHLRFSIKISAPERAMMELLSLVPEKQTFEEARFIMEGLRTLRPTVVLELLKNCNSIKVKRLFMALAEESELPWVKSLITADVDFGSGKRMLVEGGYLHPKYLITLPKRNEQ